MQKHLSVIKRARQNKKRNLRNKHVRTRVKSSVRNALESIERGNSDEAQAVLKTAISVINKSRSKGILHPNNASRKISRLTRRVNQMTSE